MFSARIGTRNILIRIGCLYGYTIEFDMPFFRLMNLGCVPETSNSTRRRKCTRSDAITGTMSNPIPFPTTIQSEDQEQVRNLFKSTYSEMFETYPSVKKLVKAALKKTLVQGFLVSEILTMNFVKATAPYGTITASTMGLFG